MMSEFGVDLGGGRVRKVERVGTWVDHPDLHFDGTESGGSENGGGITGGRMRGVRQVGSASSVEVRRRRREAVVIHEGSGAIGEGDVYMRD